MQGQDKFDDDPTVDASADAPAALPFTEAPREPDKWRQTLMSPVQRSETLPLLSLDADASPMTSPSPPPPPAVVPFVAPPVAPAPTPPPERVAPAPVMVATPVELADDAVAILCALVDLGSSAFTTVLAAAGATHDDFARSLEATTTAIDQALAAGDDTRLQLFDANYVRALEDARGSVTLERYVSLVVAQERGRAVEAFATWDYPDAALTRVLRVWQARLFDDDDLAARFDDALERARG